MWEGSSFGLGEASTFTDIREASVTANEVSLSLYARFMLCLFWPALVVITCLKHRTTIRLIQEERLDLLIMTIQR